MSEPIQIEIELSAQPLERVESGIAVAGFFSDERPLRGGAARADWRLCGGLSKRIAAGDLSGRRGEALLIGSGRALRSPRLLLLGLGDRVDYGVERLRDEVHAAVGRCLRLGCSRIALSPLGVASDDVPRHAAALIEGLRAAGSAGADPVHLTLCVPRTELDGVARAFDEARRRLRADEVRVEQPTPDAEAR